MKSPSALHQDVTALLDRLTQLPKQSEATQALTQAVRTVVNAETTVHAEKLLSVLLGAKEGQTKQGESLQLVQPHVNPAQQTKQSQPAAIQGRQADTVNQNSVQQLLSPKQLPLQQIERILTSITKQGTDGQQQLDVKQLTSLVQAVQKAGPQADAKAAVLQREFPFLSKTEANALAKVIQQTEPALSNKTDVLDLLMTMKKR